MPSSSSCSGHAGYAQRPSMWITRLVRAASHRLSTWQSRALRQDWAAVIVSRTVSSSSDRIRECRNEYPCRSDSRDQAARPRSS
jgi:hypothetical protein